jgi:predicted transcriptional regulator
MKSYEFITESASSELARELPKLSKHTYNTIDILMRRIAKKHNIKPDELHDAFVKKYHKIPDEWIKDKLKLTESIQRDYNDNPLMSKFIKWCSAKLNLNTKPNIEFSYDTDQAQDGHHTGRHTPHDGKIWVYVNNRNMVDIMRTVAHELRHLQQGERGKIKGNASYPGSPIEVDADAWAGMVIKIFGKKYPQIFE